MDQEHHQELLNWRLYGVADHEPVSIGPLDMEPASRQSCLRMLISRDGGKTTHLPNELMWTVPAVTVATVDQEGLAQNPYVYLTVRHGTDWNEDDEWHVDGFSMRVPHVPEQNYVWCNDLPTQYWSRRVRLPSSFDPMHDNIHRAIQADINRAGVDRSAIIGVKHLYRFSPYVVHRRPHGDLWSRVFVRVSFTPIPIHDMTNTKNPMLYQPHGCRDGVRDFRDRLRG